MLGITDARRTFPGNKFLISRFPWIVRRSSVPNDKAVRDFAGEAAVTQLANRETKMDRHGEQSNPGPRTALREWPLIGLYCAALLGCSSAAPGMGADGGAAVAPACTPFAACGGNLTGSWTVANSCLTTAGKKSVEDGLKLCAADTTAVNSMSLRGTVIYDGQGAVKYDLVGAVEVSDSIPMSCFPAGQQCAAYLAMLMDTGATNVRCDASATGCDCSYTLPLAQKQQNRYVIQGTTVTETDSSDGTVSTDDYCVDGNTLRIKGGDSIGVATRG